MCFSLELGLCSTSSRLLTLSSVEVNEAIANGDFNDVLLSLEAANAATENPAKNLHDPPPTYYFTILEII